MTKASTKIAPATAQSKAPVRKLPVRQAITKPSPPSPPSIIKAEIMSSTFGLEPSTSMASASVPIRTANELTDNLVPRAMAIWLQRIVEAFVSAAHGAAVFYVLPRSPTPSASTTSC